MGSIFLHIIQKVAKKMKKLLASALLSGLLVGTTSTVFAINQDEDDEVSQDTTIITTIITTQYEVTIPAEIEIDLMDQDNRYETNIAPVTLTNLTSAGLVSVVPNASNMTLLDGESPVTNPNSNQEIEIYLNDGSLGSELGNFDLSLEAPEQSIGIETSEESEDNLPGSYSGSITFTVTYHPEELSDVE